MLNYIVQLNTFENLCTGILPPKAQLIYYKLFKWSNRFGLGKPFRLSNSVLMLETGISNINTFTLNRNILKQQGFIDFKPGKPGKQTEYILFDLEKYTYKLLPQSEPNNELHNELKTEPTAELSAELQTEPPYIDSINNKQSNKTKQNETKTKKEKDFDDFWKAYPRKEGKGSARKAFEKAVKKTTVGVMLEAIEKHKASSQWQKDGGQFIPHPATWLNQERWEDEINDNAKIVPIRKNDAQAGFMGAAKLLGISEEEIWQQQGS